MQQVTPPLRTDFHENELFKGGHRASDRRHPSRRLPGSKKSPLGDRLPHSPQGHHFIRGSELEAVMGGSIKNRPDCLAAPLPWHGTL